MTVTTKATDVTGDPGFKTPLTVTLNDDGLWILDTDLVWRGSDGDLLVVAAGEETDFASVPRFAQVLLPSADNRVIRAATVHDFLCREINTYYRLRLERWESDPDITWEETADLFPKPAFSSADADAIFEKIMADEGAGWWMRNVGWLGVRYGAAVSPARRPGSLSTLPRVAGLSFVFLWVLAAIVAVVGWAYPW